MSDTVKQLKPATVTDRVIRVVSDEAYQYQGEISVHTDIYLNLGFDDELDFIGLLIELEQEFNIQIEDDEPGDLRTVGQIVEFIEKKLSKQ